MTDFSTLSSIHHRALVRPSIDNVLNISIDVFDMITSQQLRAARAFLELDQRALAELSGLSLPTIQRMEASDGVVRGNVDSLTKLIEALERAGIELVAEGAVSQGGGRGVRLKSPASQIPRRLR
jgi:hypothetical protein